jgi:predicted NBD/HSP70 family sugar kinase
MVKMLLWQKGGFRLWLFGPRNVCEYLEATFRSGGARDFDARFMARVYEKAEFECCVVDSLEELPQENEQSRSVGGHLNGCRIGFDAGGSDRKVAAVIDGEEVFSSEVVWFPKNNDDPQYHIDGIVHSLTLAAQHLPRVDAVGVSSAGIFVNNRVMIASLFRKVSDPEFEAKIKNVYLDVPQRLFGDVPVVVCNDGDVTALAGAMNLGETSVLGIAMGTSEAVGYVDRDGLISGWLNELAFAPVDFSPQGARDDEWSFDTGVGSQYLSQDAVVRLAPRAGIALNASDAPAEQLRHVQELFEQGDDRPRAIFETIGVYLGYSMLYYAQVYEIKHVLLLGRVTSGRLGSILVKKAIEVMKAESPRLASKIQVSLPDEASRRVGQAIAAASLPSTSKGVRPA